MNTTSEFFVAKKTQSQCTCRWQSGWVIINIVDKAQVHLSGLFFIKPIIY